MGLKQEALKSVRVRKYIARDFDGMRALLLEYARAYYPTKIADFSEQSLGGLFLDFASYVGDSLSFYLDHLYSELDPATAVEPDNVQRQLTAAGVPIIGASPSLVKVTAYIEVPADSSQSIMVSALPIIRANSTFTADNGTIFNLLADIDFSQTNSNGSLAASVKIGKQSATNVTKTYILALSGLCISGQEATETITVSADFVPFRQITLQNPNVSNIVSVNDSLGNIYYEVNALTNDVVYKNVLNTASDSDLVPEAIKVIPAPYRFVTNVDITSRQTTLTFGGGNADSLQDDVIPDPSSFAISFPYTKTFSRIPVNPEKLLTTTTLGVAATNTTYTITYRYGGGLNHNVIVDSIQTLRNLDVYFPGNPAPNIAAAVRSSIEVTNTERSSGGEDAPSIDDLKALIPSIRNSQERIVTREDLIARVYTLPSNFGRVFRAAVHSNPHNPLSTQLFIVSRNSDGQLIPSPDTLKSNLAKYLTPYRLITDAIDVLDAAVINLAFSFDVLVDPSLNKTIVVQNVLTKLQSFFDIKNFHIDQPITLSEISNLIFQIPGIISINKMKFDTRVGTINNRQYSDVIFNVEANTKYGLVFPPTGGLFNVAYPDVDIVGKVSV